jgi:hypothetical protein
MADKPVNDSDFRRVEGSGYHDDGPSVTKVSDWLRRLGYDIVDVALGLLGLFALLRAVVKHFGEDSEKDGDQWLRSDKDGIIEVDGSSSMAVSRKVLGLMIVLTIFSGLVAIYLVA